MTHHCKDTRFAQTTKGISSSLLGHVSGDEPHHPNGSQALSAALRTGFGVLKVLMLCLGLAFLFSNIYWVPEGAIAVHTRFGRILDQNKPVQVPGGPYFALPYPIDSIIRIPTAIRACTIDKAFWLENIEKKPESDQLDYRYSSESFRPGQDGSLITADKNLVQGIWNIHFRIDYTHRQGNDSPQVINFIRNTGTMGRAAAIIRAAAQAAIVSVIARTQTSDFVLGNISNSDIAAHINQRLAPLRTGLIVTDVSSTRYAVPKILANDFQAVTEAQSHKALEIERAVRYRVSSLNELAGEDWEELLNAVTACELTEDSDNNSIKQQTFLAAENLLFSNRIGGRVTTLINRARTDKTETIEKARSEAERFNKLLTSCSGNTAILKNQLRQDALHKIWTSKTVKACTLPSNQNVYLNLGSNPD